MPNILKKKGKINKKGRINKGTIYVAVIMICLFFAAYIMVGGTLPAKNPKLTYNNHPVSLIFPNNEPASSNLQMHTFYGVTLTPTPTPIPVPTQTTPPKTTPPAQTTPGTGGSGTNASVKITFYGSYDNDPAGSLDIAHPVKHQQAGGTGSYEDPLTFASPAGAGEYAWGTIIYVPLVQKYFIREDQCAVSWTAPDGCGAVTMVDLYVGNPSSDQSVVNCQNSLTPSGNSQIIINPPANLTYDPTPIWNQATGQCMTPHN